MARISSSGGGSSNSGVLSTAEITGEDIASNTLTAVRYSLSSDSGFVAGQVRKADIDYTSFEKFYVVGVVYSSIGVSSGGPVLVIGEGELSAPGHGLTPGVPIYLGSSGSITSTAPSSTGQAVVKIGEVKDANTIRVQIQVMGKD